MKQNNYRHSNGRMVILLGQFAIIVYTIISGKEDARLLAVLISPLWLMAVSSWIKR